MLNFKCFIVIKRITWSLIFFRIIKSKLITNNEKTRKWIRIKRNLVINKNLKTKYKIW